MNLIFAREGAELVCRAEISTPDYRTVNYDMRLNLGNENYAAFVLGAIKDQMGQHISQIREKEYGEGWREGRGKKSPKRKWFSPFWRPTP